MSKKGILLAALLLTSMSGSATALEAKLGETVVTLTPPSGQCESLSEYSAEERQQREKLFSLGNIKLLGQYANCEQLAKARTEQVLFTDYAMYTIASAAIYAKAPAGITREICAGLRTKTQQQMNGINKMADRYAQYALGDDIKLNETRLLGVLAEEPAACYYAALMKMKVGDKEVLRLSVNASVQIKDKVLFYSLHGPNTEVLATLLAKHKANVAAFIAANK